MNFTKFFEAVKTVGLSLDPYTSRKFIVVTFTLAIIILDGVGSIEVAQENINALVFVALGYFGGNALSKNHNKK